MPAAMADDEVTKPSSEERIVVTATRTETPWLTTPASVQRVSVEQQHPGLRVDAAELLQGIPGVQADTRYNFAQDTRIVLRGFGARAAFGVRGILMRLDGIPLSMPDGQAQTSSIFLDEPERVEVLRGPLAGVYGNGAGGIIDFQSAIPDSSYLRAGHAAGANSRARSTLDAAYREDTMAFSLHHARFRTDGDREQSEVERDQWAARMYYEWDNNIQLIARLDDNNAPLLQDPGSLTPEQWREDPQQTFAGASVFNTRKSIRHRQQSITLRQRLDNQQWQVAGWHGQREIEQYLPFPGDAETSSGAVIDLERGFYGMHAQYSWLPYALDQRLELNLGLDLERQEDTRLGFANDFGQRGELRRDETGKVESDDIYALSTWQFSDDWNWFVGARYSQINFSVDDRYIVPGVVPDDSGSLSYDEQSWSTGLNYQFLPDWSAFVSFGEGYETPTLTELAYQNEGTGLNTELTPAQIEQAEAGIKWQGRQGQLQFSLFDIQSRDDIVVDRSIDGRTTYRNAARTERQGAELSHQWYFHPALQLRSSASFISARYTGDELDGRRLPGIANTNLFSQLSWQPWHDNRLRAAVSALYRSRIATTDNNTEFAPSALVWNASLQARQDHQSWTFNQWLRIDNLLDRDYVGAVVVNQGSGRSFEPAPGRQLSAGVTIQRSF
ncbi:hypothetical protein CWE09_10230 [Aliidiomarina minuta]|uniref:TonB-dependent receptor n=2 Tax=Aliidiomarina minuta TaxID=880057 RepID=A0A432WA63_9GAMM|nr:hypothetical protein CWE09_10230 [Aliidiomarina minuta]